VKGDPAEPVPADEPKADEVVPPPPAEASVNQIFHVVSYRRW